MIVPSDGHRRQRRGGGGTDRRARGSAVPLAAILMPAGFFLSSMGAGREQPSRLIWLTYAGALSLAVGVVTLGLALLLRL